MNELATEKTMTVKEVADVFGVSKDTVLNCIKRIMPDKLEHGKTTFLNEIEVAKISIELKRNVKVTEQLTVEAGSTVMSRTTRLEVLANYQRANEAFIAMLESEKSELQEQVAYLTPKADVYDICCTSDNLHEIGELGKKTGIGERKIFPFLVAEKVIKYKHVDGVDFYEPCYPYDKYFDFKLQPFPKGNEIKTRNKLMLTTEGFMYFSKKYSIKNELPTKCRQLTYSETSEKQGLGGQNESSN